MISAISIVFFFASRRRHTRCSRDWSSDVCSSDLGSFASITRFVVSHLPHQFSTLRVNVAPDFRVLAYGLTLTVFTGVMFGLIPALKSSRLDLNTALKEDSPYSDDGKKSGLLRSGWWERRSPGA